MTTSKPAPHQAVIRRLRWYWPMEAWNVLLVPALALGSVWWAGERISAALVYAIYPNVALLAVGALYWRAVLLRLQGQTQAMQYWLAWFHGLERYIVIFVVLGVGFCVADWVFGRPGVPIVRIAATALSVLAVLEYVNYYRIQLQHFDHAADFRRLLTGRGFRSAHLARDLKAYRARSRRPRQV